MSGVLKDVSSHAACASWQRTHKASGRAQGLAFQNKSDCLVLKTWLAHQHKQSQRSSDAGQLLTAMQNRAVSSTPRKLRLVGLIDRKLNRNGPATILEATSLLQQHNKCVWEWIRPLHTLD